MTLAARIVPTKPGIPRRKRTRRRGKEKSDVPAVRRADQSTQLTANVKPGAAGMLARHRLVEHRAKIRAGDAHKLKTRDRAGRGRKSSGAGTASCRGPAVAKRRKFDLPVPPKTAKNGEAAGDLGLARRIDKAERAAVGARYHTYSKGIATAKRNLMRQEFSYIVCSCGSIFGTGKVLGGDIRRGRAVTLRAIRAAIERSQASNCAFSQSADREFTHSASILAWALH